MKRLSLSMMLVMTIGVCATFTSCDSGGGKEYSVVIAWEIAGMTTCGMMTATNELLGFDKMIVKVYDDEKTAKDETAEPVVAPMTTTCSLYQYTIQNLKRGTYYVVLEAWANYDGEELPYYQGFGNLVVPSDETLTIPLTMASGSVEVGWDFDKGMCEQNGVANVIVTLQNGTLAPQTSGAVPCGGGIYTFTDLDWGFYSLSVEGRNEAGVTTHRGEYIADETAVQDTETDTLLPDGGIVTDTEVDTGIDPSSNPNLLDVRPGKKILSDEAYVVLKPVTP